ncbi:MAG: hypothetical protein ABR616_15445 [Dermatophilaceae bacterium]
MDLTNALAPKSDQLDFADLDGSAPQVFTITAVSENHSELADQQPVNITLAEFPRVWRPSKGMLRVMADNWGKDVTVWIGRRVELYGDPNVYFGKEKRGGTRISRLSHITTGKNTLVNPRGGKGAYWSVKPLPDAPPPVDFLALVSAATTPDECREIWKSAGSAKALDDALKAAIQSRVTELEAAPADPEEQQ